MEEKIDVDIVKYFVLIALIGLWSICFAIHGYSSEHYISVFLIFYISLGILYFRNNFVRKSLIVLGLAFILFLLKLDISMNNSYVLYSSVILTIFLIHTRKLKDKSHIVCFIYSKLLFSCCYKYALVRHDILNLLSLPYFSHCSFQIKAKLISNDITLDIRDEYLLLIKNLGLKNKVISYSKLEVLSEKELIIGTLLYTLLVLARDNQNIYIDETGIVILHPNAVNSIEEYRKFLRYCVNGSIEYQGESVKIYFY